MKTGIKIRGAKKVVLNDNKVVGADTGYDIEAEDVTAERNEYFESFPKLNNISLAIKKPSANNNEGWKIMFVGTLLAAILSIVGLVVYDFYIKPALSNTLALLTI